MPQATAQDTAFPTLGYANCWEDAHVLCEALRPRPGSRVLSIASGGDNAFALAAEGAEVVAVDYNPVQLACVELKRAAIRRLERQELLGFFGLLPLRDRRGVYHRLAPDLSAYARVYWNAHPRAIDRGFVHSGKFEGYFSMFRRYVLPLAHGHATVQSLFEERSLAERERFYRDVWDNARWSVLVRFFFSRTVMARLGRDASFFTYVDGSLADRVTARARRALVELPTHTNPYLEYIATGTFRRSLPRYLEPQRFEAVRDGLERITLVEGPVEQAARTHGGAGFDGFNLSDLFEYLSEPVGRELHAQILQQAARGARVVYWNMMAPRRFAREHGASSVEQTDLSEALHARDPAFFYDALVIEEVCR